MPGQQCCQFSEKYINFLSICVNMALRSVVNKLCSILLLGSDINRDANPVSFTSFQSHLFVVCMYVVHFSVKVV